MNLIESMNIKTSFITRIDYIIIFAKALINLVCIYVCKLRNYGRLCRHQFESITSETLLHTA